MKLKVLGCSGAEFPGSNSPSFLLDEDILFDAGSITNVLDEDAQFKIDYIFVTHAHLDHIMGIPFLADNIIVGNVSQKVTIMSISPVIRIIKKHLLNSSVWPDFTVIPHPDDGILNLVKLKPDKPVRIRDYMITPYEVNHTVSAVGYLVEDKEEKRFFYTGDTGPSAKTWENIGDRQIHSLIIDVSFPNSMGDVAIRTGHLTPDLLREELLKLHHMPEYIYITHPKPQHYKTIKNELDKLKMKKLRLLRDGDTIRI